MLEPMPQRGRGLFPPPDRGWTGSGRPGKDILVIYICSLADVPQLASEVGPSHVISLLGDDPFPDTPASVVPDGHLKLSFHDIDEPQEGLIAPDMAHLEQLIEFSRRWEEAGPLIVHCFAGVSRSTAAALTVLCLYNQGREEEAARLLRARGPHAFPNRRMIAFADDLLGCGGRLLEAVDALPSPDFLAPLKSFDLPIRFD